MFRGQDILRKFSKDIILSENIKGTLKQKYPVEIVEK